MNDDAKFLVELLTDWKVPFDNHDFGRRFAVAQLISDKHDEIGILKVRIKELENQLKGVYIPVSDI